MIKKYIINFIIEAIFTLALYFYFIHEIAWVKYIITSFLGLHIIVNIIGILIVIIFRDRFATLGSHLFNKEPLLIRVYMTLSFMLYIGVLTYFGWTYFAATYAVCGVCSHAAKEKIRELAT